MSDEFHKPTLFSDARFETIEGESDPAQTSRVAHDTAHALLARVRESPDPSVVDRLVSFTDEHGIDDIAELWARSGARTLPGALWRIYLLRALIRQDPETISFLFQRGSEIATTIDPVIAGATVPTGPEEIRELADNILRGLFDGDFAIALDRAAAFCRLISAGSTNLADDLEVASPERATELTTRALRLSQTAGEFVLCARLWRSGALD